MVNAPTVCFVRDIMPPTYGHSTYITSGTLHLHADILPTCELMSRPAEITVGDRHGPCHLRAGRCKRFAESRTLFRRSAQTFGDVTQRLPLHMMALSSAYRERIVKSSNVRGCVRPRLKRSAEPSRVKLMTPVNFMTRNFMDASPQATSMPLIVGPPKASHAVLHSPGQTRCGCKKWDMSESCTTVSVKSFFPVQGTALHVFLCCFLFQFLLFFRFCFVCSTTIVCCQECFCFVLHRHVLQCLYTVYVLFCFVCTSRFHRCLTFSVFDG